jgi:methionyl aminopeptidase
VSNNKLQAMQRGGHILALMLEELKARTVAGVRTKEIDDWAKRLALKHGIKPSFLGYESYPAAVCVSVNDEVVHGIPSTRVVQEGDLVSLDLGVYVNGYHTDAAITFPVGEVDSDTRNLVAVTKKALELGIAAAIPGNHVGDIGSAIQNYVEKHGFGVIRSLVGHGVGLNIHEEPMVPNFGSKGTGSLLRDGMTIAIEPMVSMGGYEVYQSDDGWTYKTNDGSLVAHFEHSVYISGNSPIILTK